ncbi:hypothetical protein P3S67_029767 [Capsicum chacoense]
MIKNYLLVDTGSDLLWWQCGPCEANKCYYQHQPLYNSTASKTFRKVDCDQHGFKCKTDDPHFYCNLQSFECKYDVEYTDGSSVKGFIADDVITFVLDNRPIRVMFGCSNDQPVISLLPLLVLLALDAMCHVDIPYHRNLGGA